MSPIVRSLPAFGTIGDRIRCSVAAESTRSPFALVPSPMWNAAYFSMVATLVVIPPAALAARGTGHGPITRGFAPA